MMAEKTEDRKDDAYLGLRNKLNPIISGGVTEAVLRSVADHGTSLLIENAEAVNAQLFIASAEGRYLDELISSYGIERPGEVGLSDDIYRNLGIIALICI